MDDLAALLDEPAAEKKRITKPSTTPEQNFEAYKSEIIAIVVNLKKQGMDAEQATAALNEEGIRTLSGKGLWSTKAISQVYRLIDSATP
jgi:hypothetical protein